MNGRKRPMRRVGDLLPEAAAALGLEEELRLARAMATWQLLVEELLPPATGATRLIEMRGGTLVVEAAAPIVAQELRLRAEDLLSAFAAAPGGRRMAELRVFVRPGGSPDRPGGRV